MSYSGKTRAADSQSAKTAPTGPNGKLSIAPIPADLDKSPVVLMQLASKISLDSGNFVDTKFYAYSRRSKSGGIYSPKAIYANSWILRAKAPQYFENLLCGGYDANSVIAPLDGTVPVGHERLDEVDSLGYDSDSDIEDDDDDDDPELLTTKIAGAKLSSEGVSTTEEELEKDNAARDFEDSDASQQPGQKGRIVVLHSFAYPTWKAFIYYLYTGKVEFSRLKSQRSGAQSTVKRPDVSAAAPSCSPKSMYKLADELGISELKAIAQVDIRLKLTTGNILPELFSTFTSRYDVIRYMQIAFACDKAKDALKTGISDWMDTVPADILKRNVAVISHLVQTLASEPVAPPAPAVIARPTVCSSCNAGRSGNGALQITCYNCGNYL